MIRLSTMLDTIFPNALPMITPTARSMTFPLKAKFLNSSKSEAACWVGSATVVLLVVVRSIQRKDWLPIEKGWHWPQETSTTGAVFWGNRRRFPKAYENTCAWRAALSIQVRTQFTQRLATLQRLGKERGPASVGAAGCEERLSGCEACAVEQDHHSGRF